MTRSRWSSSVSALRSSMAAALVAGAVVAFGAVPAGQQQNPPQGQTAQGRAGGAPSAAQVQSQIDRQTAGQVETDKTWRAASEGVMQMQKITYKSRWTLRDRRSRFATAWSASARFRSASTSSVSRRWRRRPTAARVNTLRDRYAQGIAQLGVCVDRIDYTKGIPERHSRARTLWTESPELRERFTFIFVCTPSRSEVPAYNALERDVMQSIIAINEKYGTADWTPIVLINENVDADLLAGVYRAADMCIVSSLQDGMNLVAKEFVACQIDERGVLDAQPIHRIRRGDRRRDARSIHSTSTDSSRRFARRSRCRRKSGGAACIACAASCTTRRSSIGSIPFSRRATTIMRERSATARERRRIRFTEPALPLHAGDRVSDSAAVRSCSCSTSTARSRRSRRVRSTRPFRRRRDACSTTSSRCRDDTRRDRLRSRRPRCATTRRRERRVGASAIMASRSRGRARRRVLRRTSARYESLDRRSRGRCLSHRRCDARRSRRGQAVDG